jgi:sialidase-1
MKPSLPAFPLMLLSVVALSLYALEAKTVFRAGEDGYRIYRIPAVIKTANGHLLAFCEARQGGDASEIDLVLKRSKDGGQSWGSLIVVQESSDFVKILGGRTKDITIGNPAPVVDLLDPDHPGRIWLPFTLENDRVFVVSSDDNGESWSERREITKSVKKVVRDWPRSFHSASTRKAPRPFGHSLRSPGW